MRDWENSKPVYLLIDTNMSVMRSVLISFGLGDEFGKEMVQPGWDGDAIGITKLGGM